MSLRFKMILWFAVIALIVGTLGAVAVNRQKAAAEALAMKDAEHIVASLGASITFEDDPQTNPALYRNRQALQGYVELLHHVYQRDLEIVDLNKIIIADVIKKDIGTLLTHDSNNEVGQTLKDGSIRYYIEKSEEYPQGIKLIVSPLKNMKGDIIGALIFEYTPIINELAKITNSTIKQLILATLICLLLAIILGFVFSEHIIRPINRLKSTALEIVNGNISAQAPIVSKDEIGELAATFNTMTSSLAQSNQKLQAEITERRRTSEERDQVVALLDTMAVLVLVLDQEGRIIRFNRACQRVIGYSQEEVQGRPIWEIMIAPEDVSRTQAMFTEMLAGRIPPVFEVDVVTKGGERRLFSWYYALLATENDTLTSIIGAGLDITDRKRAERSLAEQFNFLQLLIDTIPSPIFYKDINGVYQGCNQYLADFLGKPKEAIIGKTVFDVYPKEQAGKYYEMDQKLIQNPGIQIYEFIMGRSDGSIRNFIFNKATFVDSAGKVTGLIGVMTDITERKLVEEALLESDKRFRDVTENAQEWVWEVDTDGKYTYSSPIVEKLLGYKPNEILDKHFYDLYIPEEREELKKMAFATLGAKQPYSEFINRNLHKDGSVVWLSTSGAPVLDKTGNLLGYRGADIDVTDRQRAQEALENANIQLKVLVQEAEERNSTMARLNNMSEMLQTCQTSEEAFATISHFVPKFFPTDAGALYLLRNSKNLLSSVTTWGPSPPIEEMFPPDDCWAVRSGRVHRVDDPASPLLCKHIPATGAPASGYLCVPLAAHGVSLGILHIRFLCCATQGREAEELEAKQRLAVAIGENLALSLANLKLRETLQNQAIRDPLTGLYNRRYLEETMDRELHRSRRLKAPLGVVMMDLDHFKDFNDSFGHGAGDALLSALAHVITAGIRTEDIACRYGGEEFLLVLPGASLEITRERADNLRQAVKALQVKYHGRFLKSTTISLGIAIFPDQGHTAEEVITAADAALYRAKQAGRDRVEIATLQSPAAAAP